MRILVSGGGTGGHISPILATVDALKRLDKKTEILYVGQKGSMEAKIAASAGLKFAAIKAGKFRRYHNTSLLHKITDLSTVGLNLRDLIRVVQGLIQSLKILRQFKPEVIFLKGGYVALPVGLAAKLLGIPYVVHESDIVPGLTNQILGKSAVKIAVNFPVNYYTTWPKDKLVHTGIPVREEFTSRHRLDGLVHFKFSDQVPVVMVMGGSGGARRINQVIIEALPELLRYYQVIHITGEHEIERVRFEVKRLNLEHPERYQQQAFLLGDLGLAYAAADVVVSRAGTNSIAELAVLAKPTILIPASQLRDQPRNAQALARMEAVRVIQEDKLSPERLINEIKRILDSNAEAESLAGHLKAFAVSDSADRLAILIVSAGKKRVEQRQEEEDSKAGESGANDG